MLMITRSEESDLTSTLKIEGKLLGPWIGELELVCGHSGFTRTKSALTSAGLTFLDAEGARFLKSLICAGHSRHCLLRIRRGDASAREGP